MYAKQPKKLLLLNILDILKQYTDENHRLSQREIADILKEKYEMNVDRKAIRRNILNLLDAGYNIEYNESVRMVQNPKTGEMEETYIWSDFYLEREIGDSELRLLIDSLQFTNYLPERQRRELIEKLQNLSTVYFRSHVKPVSCLPREKENNKQFFLNIELLDEAIRQQRKISFHYLEYGTDKKLHRKTNADGTVREYIINPYQMAAKENKYYLICNHENYDNISNYRIDRIVDIQILDDPVKEFEKLSWSNGGRLDLKAYMNEHPYMYSSPNVRVKFWICRPMISDVIDIFGEDVTFSEETEKGVVISMVTNERAAEQFAKNYSPDVIILAPQSLRDKLRKNLQDSLSCYETDVPIVSHLK